MGVAEDLADALAREFGQGGKKGEYPRIAGQQAYIYTRLNK